MSDILLGFEIGPGKEVRIPYAHTVVCGQTQASGKTTTLEGLLSRTGDQPRPALAFLTKRAESAFAEARIIPPYFRERADWQFVESILEAMMRERMKYERQWIIRVCQGARSLEQVAKNVELQLHGDRKHKAASGYAAGMYLQLSEYFKLLMPELERLKLSMHGAALDLTPGLNVMDLSDYSMEMQSLSIASSMEEIYRRRNVITVIPEAWEFLPQARNTPVKLAGEALIRKGAAAHNFMWLDSQDITGVDKRILKQVGVWILGVQREINEVEHTLSQMAVPKKLKPQVEDVMQLRRGQFFVCFEDVLKKVYVLPRWMPQIVGKLIATQKDVELVNTMVREAISRYQPKHKQVGSAGSGGVELRLRVENHSSSGKVDRKSALPGVTEDEEANVDYKMGYENLLEEVKELKTRLAKYENAKPAPVPVSRAASSNGDSEQEVAISLERNVPVIDVTVRKYVLQASDDSMDGQIAVLLSEGYFDDAKRNTNVGEEFRARGWMSQTSNTKVLNLPLSRLVKLGFLRVVGQATYQAVPGMKVNVKEVQVA